MMPIKDRSLYPPPKEWQAIRQRILERAKNCCEECGLKNGRMIVRSSEDKARYLLFDWEDYSTYRWPDGSPIRLSEVPEEYAGDPIKVVLTISHQDHNPANNADTNLKALCQRCHNRHDAAHRARNAKRTRATKKDRSKQADGQLPLGIVE